MSCDGEMETVDAQLTRHSGVSLVGPYGSTRLNSHTLPEIESSLLVLIKLRHNSINRIQGTWEHAAHSSAKTCTRILESGSFLGGSLLSSHLKCYEGTLEKCLLLMACCLTNAINYLILSKTAKVEEDLCN